MTDGSRRCVPVGASASIDADGPFLDAECEEPLIEVPAADACNPMPEYAQRADASKALAAVYELGAQLRNPPAAVYFLAAGECTRRNPKPAIEYHRLGARLDLAVVREQLY
jgi:hypothetical protein